MFTVCVLTSIVCNRRALCKVLSVDTLMCKIYLPGECIKPLHSQTYQILFPAYNFAKGLYNGVMFASKVTGNFSWKVCNLLTLEDSNYRLMVKMNNNETIVAEIISDEEVINRIVNGEKELYAILVRRYNQRLYRVGMAILNDDAEVEDVMQVAYINAYENLGKFGFRSSFSTWLTRILVNECLLRRRKRKKVTIMSDDNMKNLTAQHNGSQNPVSALLNSELKSLLNNAIRKLPEIYRTVFVMREIENMSVSETQQCLNISEVNVKVRLNRAKVILRDILSKYYKKEDIFHFHLNRCDQMVNVVMHHVRNS
jgi:RNA polymerase sigma factor (sigma-70 family)